MKKAVSILILLIATYAWGTTYYVNGTTGNDTFGNGTETWVDTDESTTWTEGDTGPWATIQKGIDTVATGNTINVAAGTYGEIASNYLDFTTTQNGKTISIVGADRDTTILSCAGGAGAANHCIYFNTVTNAVISFSNMTIQGTSEMSTGGAAMVYMSATAFGTGAATPMSVSFTNCKFAINNLADAKIAYSADNTGPSYRIWNFTNCLMNAKGTNLDQAALYLRNSGKVTLTNCQCYHNGAGATYDHFLYTFDDGSDVSVTGCTFGGGTGDNVLTKYAVYMNNSSCAPFTGTSPAQVNIANNTITTSGSAVKVLAAGAWFTTGIAPLTSITGNTITAATAGLALGYDTSGTVVAHGPLILKNNTVNKSGTGAGHMILVGMGYDYGGEVAYNYAVNPSANEYALVIKGMNLNVHHNYAKAVYALTVKGAGYNNIHHNTCISTGKNALRIERNTATYATRLQHYNTIEYNIFDATSGTFPIFLDETNGTFKASVLNNNMYIPASGSTSVYTLNELAGDTLTALKTYWSTNGLNAISKTNDSTSITAASARFVNIGANDFTLLTNSPALNWNSNTYGYAYCGAWGPKYKQPAGLRGIWSW